MVANVRTLRLADGPDEVHTAAIAKLEIAKWSQPRCQIDALAMVMKMTEGVPLGTEPRLVGVASGIKTQLPIFTFTLSPGLSFECPFDWRLQLWFARVNGPEIGPARMQRGSNAQIRQRVDHPSHQQGKFWV
jgi:hypothetical protein